jgi:Ca2+-dependent lipid-binding protein
VAAHKKTIQLALRTPGSMLNQKSEIGISAVEVNAEDTMVKLKISGRKLDRRDLFGKSDPYLEIHRCQPDGTWFVVHRTQFFKKNLNPDWPEFDIPQSRLIGPGGKLTTLIKMRVLDWDVNAEPDLIGETQTTLEDMKSTPNYMFPIFHPKKIRQSKPAGHLLVQSIQFEKIYSFLDYLANGTQMHLMVSVDFTASNGMNSFTNYACVVIFINS